MLVGDSLTQGGWAPGDTGIGQRLARSYHLFSEDYLIDHIVI